MRTSKFDIDLALLVGWGMRRLGARLFRSLTGLGWSAIVVAVCLLLLAIVVTFWGTY